MRHPRRMRRQRFGAAERHGELGDLERVEEGERFLLATLEIEREGRSRPAAMPRVDVGLALVLAVLEEAEIADTFDLRMVAQEFADLDRILARAAHAQFERF